MQSIPCTTTRFAVQLRRPHPRIVLDHCHICAGRGYVFTIRNRNAVRETCVNCAGRGTVVRDAA